MISVLTYFCSQQITHVPTQTKTSKSFTALELCAQNVQKKNSVKTTEKEKVVKTTKEFFKTAKKYHPRVARAKRSAKNSVKTTQEESAVSRVW